MVIQKDERAVCILEKSGEICGKKSKFRNFIIKTHFNRIHPDISRQHKKLSGDALTEIFLKYKVEFEKNCTEQTETVNLTEEERAKIAGLQITYLICKKKKPFIEGNLIKECTLKMCNTLFPKNSKIINAIDKVSLTPYIITRNQLIISENIKNNLIDKISDFQIFFYLH